MVLIEPQEMARFSGILKVRSMSHANFDLQETDLTDPKSDELLPMKGYVKVHRLSTNTTREYPIGDCTSWVEKFQKDLDDDQFG